MEHYEDRFDFRAGDKRRPREKRLDAGIPCRACGAYVPHDYEYREQRQYPSFGVFVKLVSMFDISVDQFIHSDSGNKESLCRKHIDVLLNTMNEKELVVMEATAEGLKKARETEVSG